MLNEEVATEVREEKLTAEDLKQIAQSVRAAKDKPRKAVEVDPLEVDRIVAEVVEYMHAAAHKGDMEFTYPFEDNPRELMEAVSSAVRAMYPQNLMIIKDGGANKLTLNWSGKNEV